MAPFDSHTIIRVRDAFGQPTLGHFSRPAKVKTYAPVIPPRQSALLVLDDRPYSGAAPTNNLVYLRLVSTVPGVHAWPIDSPTPEVGRDMRPFGWLFDWTAATFDHQHGDTSDQVVDHAAGQGVQAFHANSFPCFQNFIEDMADPTGNHAVFSLLKSYPAPDVFAYDGQGSCVQDFSTTAGTNGRVVMYMLGPSGYYDLGVNTDGLGFVLVVYVDNANSISNVKPGFNFFSYPFVEGVLDLANIPAVTPGGDLVWSASDRNLCRKNSVGPLITGWDPEFFTSGPAPLVVNSATTTPFQMADGLQSLWYPKLRPVGQDGPACPMAGFSPTWRRVTQIALGFGDAVADVNGQVANLFFCPRPDLWMTLDPKAYLTHHPWSDDSVPAIGFQNPTDVPATVHIEYGVDG